MLKLTPVAYGEWGHNRYHLGGGAGGEWISPHVCARPPPIQRDGPSCITVPFVPSTPSMGKSGCEVESIFLNVEAVNTHRERPQVRGGHILGGGGVEKKGTLSAC